MMTLDFSGGRCYNHSMFRDGSTAQEVQNVRGRKRGGKQNAENDIGLCE